MFFTGKALAGLNEKPQILPSKSDMIEKTKRLHIPFIANEGQMDERVAFYARTFGGTVFVTKDGQIVYSLPKAKEEGKTLEGWVIKEDLVNGTIKGVKAEDRSITNVSYFIGNDPSMWRNKVSTYGLVNLGEVYNGIELKLKAYGNNVEKLFYVRPDAKPKDIRIKLNGAKTIKVNEMGELEVTTELGPVRFTKPLAYQEIEGQKELVEVAYIIHKGNTYGFNVANYDNKRPLIIDPLLASTFLGGASSNDHAYSIALDGSGNVYVTGLTMSSDYPVTPGAYDESFNGIDDAFVSMLDPNLSADVPDTDPDILVIPASYDFGNVPVGSLSTPQTFTISNTGTADLVIGTITITGTNASDFSIQNDNCSGQTIAPSFNCTVQAVFSAASAGTKNANISNPSNDPDTPTFEVPLSGTGIAPLPDLTGEWTKFFVYKNKIVLGSFTVSNIGVEDAKNFKVEYYLSDDNVLDAGDKLIRSRTVFYLSDGKNRTLGFMYWSKISLQEKFIIAVVDSYNQVLESDEGNNILSSSQIQ
jgi:hypothetical protein